MIYSKIGICAICEKKDIKVHKTWEYYPADQTADIIECCDNCRIPHTAKGNKFLASVTLRYFAYNYFENQHD